MQTSLSSIESSSLLDEKAVATYLGVSVEFLQQDRSKRKRIPFVKLGRAVRYDPADVKAYAASCKRGGSQS